MRPRKIMREQTEWLRKELDARGLSGGEYKVYVTDTVRGRCHRKHMNITVPLWAVMNGERGASVHKYHEFYYMYYICHELAHSVTPYIKGQPHGPEFMKSFIRLCPKELQYFELGYKPRNAAAAGIKA